jgi:hypothetical protein
MLNDWPCRPVKERCETMRTRRLVRLKQFDNRPHFQLGETMIVTRENLRRDAQAIEIQGMRPVLKVTKNGIEMLKNCLHFIFFMNQHFTVANYLAYVVGPVAMTCLEVEEARVGVPLREK